MKIAAVESWTDLLPLTRPYTIAFTTIRDTTIQVVRLVTDSGVTGIGTGTPFPSLTGETAEDCSCALAPDLLDWLIGRNPVELRGLCRENARRHSHLPAACAALDIALHDLCATALGMPLVDLLGRVHDALPTSLTIGIMPAEEAIDVADEYLGSGIRALKVKVGRNLDEDVDRLRRLREHAGPGVTLRADANQGYTPEQLAAFLSLTKHLDIEFVEQPVVPAEFGELANLTESDCERIAADESLMSEFDCIRLVHPRRLCGIFNIKLMKCGGLFSALRIADIAELMGIELMWGCMDESLVSITAALHAAFSCPATRYLDLDGSLDLARDVAEGGFILQNGMMTVPDAPGLGVTLLQGATESACARRR
jgi:L-alanine-DL-glutamate epimerase-like enolase superfamily enzyme